MNTPPITITKINLGSNTMIMLNVKKTLFSGLTIIGLSVFFMLVKQTTDSESWKTPEIEIYMKHILSLKLIEWCRVFKILAEVYE